jgi:CobQ-like glutamine amidotransferase family enzyme
MDLVEVEITGMVITHRYGTLQTGAVLRTDKEYADHLVNDCAAAKYKQPEVDPSAGAEAAAKAADAKTKQKK